MTKSDVRSWLCGPMVAVATPFTEEYELDLDALQENIRYMIDGGVRTGNGTLLVGGAGGEHPTLNAEERKSVMSASVEAANGEAPVLTSIQHTDVRVMVDLAKHAESSGVHGVQLGPTYYYEPTESDVQRLFDHVASKSDIPLMVYHTWWEGLTMSQGLIENLAEMDTVVALKWSSDNDTHYREVMMSLADEVVIIDNSGSHILSHVLGGRGFITHLSGFWPQYPGEIWGLLEQQRYQDAQKRLSEFKWKWTKWRSKVTAVTGGEGPFIKAAMETVGLKAGPPRPPSVRPPENLMDELRDLLKESGVPFRT